MLLSPFLIIKRIIQWSTELSRSAVSISRILYDLWPKQMQRKKIKAVFFGVLVKTRYILIEILCWTPFSTDLDDTLVLTKNADLRAYEYVTTLAQQSHSHLDATRLIADWKGLFAVNPWDPEDKVCMGCLLPWSRYAVLQSDRFFTVLGMLHTAHESISHMDMMVALQVLMFWISNIGE